MEVLGIDGCRAGWVMAGVDERGCWHVDLASGPDDLYTALRQAQLALIDIPIGLMDTGGAARACDRAARALLGRPRASSVFRPPCRPALEADDHGQACAINAALTGVRLSKQAWHIGPKIRQIDRLLATHTALSDVCREAHPEVCFWALNDRQAMGHDKRTQAGFEERAALLRRFDADMDAALQRALQRFQRRQMARDDVVDALVLGLSAHIGLPMGLHSVPDPPEHDAVGRPMAIWYATATG